MKIQWLDDALIVFTAIRARTTYTLEDTAAARMHCSSDATANDQARAWLNCL